MVKLYNQNIINMVYIIIFSHVTIIKDLINFKSFINYINFIILKVIIKIIISLIIKKFVI